MSQWKTILLERYLDICPVHNDTRLPGISTPGYLLDNFKIYWDKLLERSNFVAPMISLAERATVEVFLKGLVHRGILEEIQNPCKLVLHPVIVIPKKEKGKLRLVIDFRALNKLFNLISFDIRDRQKLIREIPENAKYYTVIDIKDAFFQIRIDDSKLRNFFGIHILGKYYRFTCLPQGWKNSPAVCQMTYESILGYNFRSFCRLYMDDIIIFSETLDQHWEHVNKVLTCLQQNNIQIAWSKMELARDSVEYLGIEYTKDGIRPARHILEKLQSLISIDCNQLQNWRSVRGLLNQFQRYGPRFNKLVEEYRFANAQRKQQILEQMGRWAVKQGNTISAYWRLYTDWCKTGQGYVLLNDKNLPVIWNSKMNSVVESRYSSELGEASAALWAINETLSFWRGAPIQLCSDSKDFILTCRNLQRVKDIRLLRRIDYLLEIPQLQVTFTPGEYNQIADMFSRAHEKQFIQMIANPPIPEQIWRSAHRGHFDAERTYKNLLKISKHYSLSDVQEQLKFCRPCQRFRARRPIDLLGKLDDPKKPGEVITCDFLGRLPKGRSNARYILSIVDYLSRWASLGLSEVANSNTVIEGLNKWISLYGKPRRLICDPASYNRSVELKTWLSAHNIEVIWSPPGSHKSNGLVERFNQTLIGRIRRLLMEDRFTSWEQTLPEALQAIRTTCNSTINYTPEAVWQGDSTIWKNVRANMEKARNLANARLHLRCHTYAVGDRVWLWDSERPKQHHRKFAPFWLGPWTIVEPVSRSVWRIQSSNGYIRMVHSDMLQPFY